MGLGMSINCQYCTLLQMTWVSTGMLSCPKECLPRLCPFGTKPLVKVATKFGQLGFLLSIGLSTKFRDYLAGTIKGTLVQRTYSCGYTC